MRSVITAPFLLFLLLFCFAAAAVAQTDIYVRGSGKLFPIALPQLCAQSGDPAPAKQIPDVLARDLDLSGYFQVLSPGAYVESPGRCGEEFAYSDWTIIGAEGLVRGVVSAEGTGIRVRLYLHDVHRQKVVLGKEYTGDYSQVDRMAHRFANEIMKFFTGEAGVFGTQISFSSRVGRFKELFVMEMDGSNMRQLTNERALAVSSSWDPSGSKLLYTSYRTRVPDIFELDINSRASRQITKSQALDLGARYSRDGATILASLTESNDSDIVLLNRNGGVQRRLTPKNGAIDVSPVWSPDQSQIAFCSNRAGGPQIYVMNADGSAPRRISFVTSNYCTSPAWSPKGDQIAFVCRADAGFQMFTAGVDGSNPMQLTSAGDNEDPDFSPDGRYIVFATTFWSRGIFHLALMRSDGTSMRELTKSRGGDFEPSWGPLLP